MIRSENKDIEERWKEYFNKLLNTKNRTPEIVAMEKAVEDISEKEVGNQIERIKLNIATGLDELLMNNKDT